MNPFKKTIHTNNKLIAGFLLVITILCSNACKKERQIIIEAPFQEYVDNFFLEADKRNIKISRNNLEVVFQEHPVLLRARFLFLPR